MESFNEGVDYKRIFKYTIFFRNLFFLKWLYSNNQGKYKINLKSIINEDLNVYLIVDTSMDDFLKTLEIDEEASVFFRITVEETDISLDSLTAINQKRQYNESIFINKYLNKNIISSYMKNHAEGIINKPFYIKRYIESHYSDELNDFIVFVHDLGLIDINEDIDLNPLIQELEEKYWNHIYVMAGQ